jgi:hypothetical protein
MSLVAVGRGVVVVLTRPKTRVITKTKWEPNITKKYRVASSAMVLKMLGPLTFDAFDFAAKKVINANARRSGV